MVWTPKAVIFSRFCIQLLDYIILRNCCHNHKQFVRHHHCATESVDFFLANLIPQYPITMNLLMTNHAPSMPLFSQRLTGEFHVLYQAIQLTVGFLLLVSLGPWKVIRFKRSSQWRVFCAACPALMIRWEVTWDDMMVKIYLLCLERVDKK